jgi:hypothetical protein
MQETILILSRCQTKRMSPRTQKCFYRFHFRGFYCGSKIKEVHVYANENETLQKGEDYLLWVRYLSVKSTILEVSLIRYKEIK